MISIVIPLYNKRDGIGKALQSVFAQTFTDYEIIVVDDGSTDGSEEEVVRLQRERDEGSERDEVRGTRYEEGFRNEGRGTTNQEGFRNEGRRTRVEVSVNGDQQPTTKNQKPATSNQKPKTSNQPPATGHRQPIRLIRQANAGVSAARNRGIAEAHGEWIALLDADDEWKPDYLATIANMINRFPDCDVLATNYEMHQADGKIIPTILNKIKFKGTQGVLDNYFEVASSSNPPLWTSAVCARKSAFEAIGGFPTGIIQGEDLLTWAKLASRYKIAYCLKPLAVFNIEEMNRNSRPKRIPPVPDRVGEGLKQLRKEYNPPYIREYLSFWHKMRSALFWRLKEKGQARKEALKAICLNPLNYKAYVLLALNMI